MALLDLAYMVGIGTKAFAEHQSGSYQKKIAEFNAEIANEQADNAIERGRRQEFTLRQDYAQLQGKQRAIMAAQGLNLEEDTALNIQMDARRQEEIDILTLRNNAMMEAWGYQVNAYDYTQRGEYASKAGNMAAFTTVLTGAADYALATGALDGGKRKPKISRG